MRSGSTFEWLALPATRVLPGHGSLVLVSRRPAVSAPARWSPWLLIPYLLLADVQNTALSALLTFADRVLYPYYAEVPACRRRISALDDQSAAGVVMWVPGRSSFCCRCSSSACNCCPARVSVNRRRSGV